MSKLLNQQVGKGAPCLVLLYNIKDAASFKARTAAELMKELREKATKRK